MEKKWTVYCHQNKIDGKKLSEEHKAKLFAGQRRYINKMQAQKEVAPNA